MSEGLGASPQYGEKIKKVRNLPKEGKGKIETKEQAKLLRMEIMLDNAECARLLTAFVENHPTATAEDFQDYAFATGLISQPQAIQDFIDQLRYERDRVLRAKSEIKHHSKQNNISQGRVVFSWMGPIDGINPFIKPEGKVELDSSYPLALILYIENSDDFHAIDSRTNVGGFYKSVQNYGKPNASATTMVSDSFPVVVVYGPNDKNLIETSSTTRHEKGHAENKAIQEALGTAKKKMVWAERPFNYTQNYNARYRLKDTTPENIEKAKRSKDWHVLLDAALTLAKDELLAEFKARQGNTEWHQSYMKKREGLYDYFAIRLVIPPESELYKELWKDYEKILDDAQIVIDTLVKGYHTNNLILKDRIDLLKWVLAQIPIQNWDEQIRGTLFYQEIVEFNEVNNVILNKIFSQSNWRNTEDPKVALGLKLFDELRQNQTKPLLPIIRKFKEDIAKL